MKHLNNIIYPFAAAVLMTAPGAFAQDAEDHVIPADSLPQGIQLAFRTADGGDILGGVSAVNVAELDKKSFTDYSLSNMSALTTGYNGQLWGMGDALVLVDGVPRDANNILPQEIESISFLKGAQAVVLYGSTAAKGVILITTKRGNTNGLQISVRGNASMYVPKRYQKYLGAAEYMTLFNEARANDGLDPSFSDMDIYNYGSHNNLSRYPDINFFSDDYLKKNWMKYEGQAEFKGGAKFAQFYCLVDVYHVGDVINFGEGKHNGQTRLSLRGNIDLRLNDWVTGWVNTSATFYDNRYDRANYWNSASTMRPAVQGNSPFVPFIPIDAVEPDDEESWALINNSNYLIDGKYLLGGTQQYQTNAFAAMYAAGYTKSTTRQLQFDAGIRVDFRKAVPGLSFTAHGAVDYNTQYSTSLTPDYAVYEATWANYGGRDVITSLKKYNDDFTSGNMGLSGSSERQTMLFSGQFDYKRTFNDVHTVDATLVAHAYKRTVSGQYHRNTNATFALRAAYDYANRYYAEFNGAVNHSVRFKPGHRNGFSPVGSIGWRIKNEEFLKDNDVISDLRVNATYGVLLQDIDVLKNEDPNQFDSSFYLWDGRFSANGAWWGWNDGHNSITTFISTQGENPDLTFVKRKEFNVGLDMGFLNNMIRLSGAYYRTNVSGLPVQATTIFPSYMLGGWSSEGNSNSFIPYVNYNAYRVEGFELGVNFNKNFGDFKVGFGANVMYNDIVNTQIFENYEYEWQKTEGAHRDAMRGYKCLGFFQSEEEIAESALINSNTKPGDLKYKDMNDDGIIDSKDMVEIGRWNQPWNYGLNLTLGYKGFTLFVTATGAAGGTGIKTNDAAWVFGDRKYTEIVRGRWTPETASTATYPRLTTQGGELNFVYSDFWTYDASSFGIDQIQLTYDFPAKWFAGKFVKGLQAYVNGNSIWWTGKEKAYRETNIGSGPQTRNFNFGVKVNF
ncbi:MAG: SusC/RagA family TonB-linked outer membrane protein [Muribaculaceae bacterium]|nr:SusC/RagA family TonB-linked outer membrane protein [Muribaculaceae bacterium]